MRYKLCRALKGTHTSFIKHSRTAKLLQTRIKTVTGEESDRYLGERNRHDERFASGLEVLSKIWVRWWSVP